MSLVDLNEIREFVNEHIVLFHNNKLNSLRKLKLAILLRKNPYLFKAKNLQTAGELVSSLLDAFLSSSEEKLFGDFLEDLALFIARKASDGRKSSAPGIDLEFSRDGIHYIVSIKSSINWGNSSQHRRLEQDLKEAVQRIKQSGLKINVQSVLGICYGKTRTGFVRGYLKVVGQNFWYLISEDKNLYIDIIKPIGFNAKQHNDQFLKKKSEIINSFTGDFIKLFCDPSGAINWSKLVEFNSGNYDLDKFL